MKHSDKIRVAVLYGGRSAEHEISLRSAANIINTLDSSRFDVIPIGIDKQGNWFLGKDIFLKSLQDNKVHRLEEKNHTWFTPEWVGKSIDKRDIQEVLTQKPGALFDVVFPAVHGAFCEDGCLQGLLELANLPYVGCGVLASAIGMDKDISKRLARLAGIEVAPYQVINWETWLAKPDVYLQEINEKLAFPVFVKPANTGSSVGICKVKSKEALHASIDEAFRFDTKVLVEKAISAIELEIAVLESLVPGADPIVSVVGEVRPTHEFYSYDAKYMDENGAELFVPAPIAEKTAEDARTMAKELFHILACEGMARVDLFLDKNTQTLYFNEVNTIPGFTPISMYPKLLNASGVSNQALLTHLIELAIKRHKNKSKLMRSYEE